MEIVWPELLSNLVYEVGASRRWQNRTAKLLAFPVTNPWLLNPDRTNPGYQFPSLEGNRYARPLVGLSRSAAADSFPDIRRQSTPYCVTGLHPSVRTIPT
jgi:hypothetical protein